MTKEVRHFEVGLEKLIFFDVLVDKEMPQEKLYKAIYKHFKIYGNDWGVDKESINVMPGQRYSLKEFMVKSAKKRNLTVIVFHDDDCDDDNSFSIDHVIGINRKELNNYLRMEEKEMTQCKSKGGK